MRFDERLNQVWWILRVAFGLVPIVAGADKFFNLLTNWEMYLHPAVPAILHIQASTFMHVVGVIEIAAGLIVLSNFTRWGAYIVTFWLLGIALQLIARFAFLDIAVRDIMMALAAFTLARLTEVRQEAVATENISVRQHQRVVA